MIFVIPISFDLKKAPDNAFLLSTYVGAAVSSNKIELGSNLLKLSRDC